MSPAATIVTTLALTLCVAAVTTVICQRLRQPLILGYILAGFIVSPYTAIPINVHLPTAEALSQIGIIVLVFSIGLEFDLRKMIRLGPAAGLVAAIEVAAMVWLGFLVGRVAGLGVHPSLFVGGIIAISSTSIAAKTLGEERVERRLRDLAFGITVVEDMLGILLLAMFSALAAGAELSADAFAGTILRLGAVLVAMVAVGLLIVPRFLSYVVGLGSRETTLVTAVGVAFGFALIAQSFGYSVALGAFLGGLLASESGQARRIEHLVRPIRDVFAAIFFVSVGMLVDPALIAEHWVMIAALAVVVVLGKITAIALGAILIGYRIETALRVGMSLSAVGELSFLFANVGLQLGPSMGFLQPVAAAVCVLTSAVTPMLVRRSERLSMALASRAPERVRTFLALYDDWLDDMRRTSSATTLASRLRRLIGWVLVDAALLLLLVGVLHFTRGRILEFARELLGLPEGLTLAILVALQILAAAPFLVGIARCIRRLGELIAPEVIPHVRPGQLDLAAAPRKALTAGLQVALLVMVGLPLLAALQPFLPTLPGVLALLALIALAAVVFWRSASNLEGHVRAGTTMIVEALGRQSRQATPPSLAVVTPLLPGMGRLSAVRLEGTDTAVGHSVKELNLHGRTGATLLCVTRGQEGVIAAADDLRLSSGDVVTLAGSEDALARARELLVDSEEGPEAT